MHASSNCKMMAYPLSRHLVGVSVGASAVDAPLAGAGARASGSGVGADSSWDKFKGGMIDDKKRR